MTFAFTRGHECGIEVTILLVSILPVIYVYILKRDHSKVMKDSDVIFVATLTTVFYFLSCSDFTQEAF